MNKQFRASAFVFLAVLVVILFFKNADEPRPLLLLLSGRPAAQLSHRKPASVNQIISAHASDPQISQTRVSRWISHEAVNADVQQSAVRSKEFASSLEVDQLEELLSFAVDPRVPEAQRLLSISLLSQSTRIETIAILGAFAKSPFRQDHSREGGSASIDGLIRVRSVKGLEKFALSPKKEERELAVAALLSILENVNTSFIRDQADRILAASQGRSAAEKALSLQRLEEEDSRDRRANISF